MTALALLPPATDAEAFLSGFGLGLSIAFVLWAAVVGVELLRRMFR